ncbi:MAG: DUF1015 domain-containing protein, partial [Candidatus Altiarchaeales archaeon]|nr:DUF1015 domain-containing protein [Candidatus Altiarchaeales archaeon]
MVEVRPFKGIVFNKKKVGDIRLVLTPPYDVISKEEEKVYSENSPYNIVRLILPKGGEKRYENSA